MKIGFDISQAAHSGGVAVYTENLASELEKIDDLNMVYFYSSLRKPYKGILNNVKKYKLPPTLFEVMFNRIRNIKIEKFIGEVDVFHSSDWIQPPTKAKKITTYHDVIPLKFPKWSHPKIVSVQKRRLKIVEEEIDLVIAVSESTKKDLLEISKIPEEKIKVIYEGVDEIFKPQNPFEIEEFKKRYHLPSKFILAIGGIGERKNIERIKKAAEDFNLVILGQTIQINREKLPLLYASAEALVYTTLYEGFGLPILEAFACGIPVVTSNISSMPEIANDVAILVSPTKVDEIRKGIMGVIEDKNLKKLIIKKGIEQSKKFSWEKCAKETVALYRKLYAPSS